MDEQRDKIKDLEVKEDEARDIAGGKEANAIRWKKGVAAKKAGKSATGIRHGKPQS